VLNNLLKAPAVVGKGLEASDAFVGDLLLDRVFAERVDGVGQGLRKKAGKENSNARHSPLK
jgi:hypothetical protein